MTREELITNLKYTMKKHENDTVRTFGTNISVMCKDVLDYLEQEPTYVSELTQKAYEDGKKDGYVQAKIEQEPKSEWQKDHEILKAYSDGANEVLDKISAEIEQNAYPIVHGVNNHELGMTLYGINQVFDKYKAESEPQESEEL